MDPEITQALQDDLVIDITTTGRISGEPRRIEIWLRPIDGRYFIAGLPGPRGWFANLRANPAFTVHVKRTATADLPARALPVDDTAEKRRLLEADEHGPGPDAIDDWVANSPMVEVRFE